MKTSALELIGKTPAVQLRALSPPGATVIAKAEFMNPGGSVKDRAALQIIESAHASGALRAGQPVVEMTSGNMGAGLAVVCAVKRNPLLVVMSRGNSPERARMMSALGAEVLLVDQVDGAPGQVTGLDIAAAEARARRLAVEHGAFYVDQFHNPGTADAHELTTGPELLAQCNGLVDTFVAVVGSGGTFIGVSRYLKQVKPSVSCIAVEPENAAVLAGRPVRNTRHLLQGAGYGAMPPQWQLNLADGFATVSDQEATETKRLLAQHEGLHVGYSAAANVCAALKLARSGTLGSSAVIATILCDTGLKYPPERQGGARL